MRFSEFLRATVLLSAAAASALAVVTVGGAVADDEQAVVFIGAGWWLIAAVIGSAMGRRAEVSPPIRDLLARARKAAAMPELLPGRVMLERLWPLLLPCVAAGILAFRFPQVAAVAAGFAEIWALSWRRQASAVTAIEERDGVSFFVEASSPFKAIELVVMPGLRREFPTPNGRLS